MKLSSPTRTGVSSANLTRWLMIGTSASEGRSLRTWSTLEPISARALVES